MKRCLMLRSTQLGMMLIVMLRMLPLLKSLIMKVLIMKLLILKLIVLKLRQAKCMLDIISVRDIKRGGGRYVPEPTRGAGVACLTYLQGPKWGKMPCLFAGAKRGTSLTTQSY